MSTGVQILTAILGSGSLFSFITFLIMRHDKLVKIEKRLDKNERDNCRTQILLLMSDYPHEKNEIMTIAEHYFKDLGGNWYMTAIFRKWLKENGIERPEWFNPSKDTNI